MNQPKTKSLHRPYDAPEEQAMLPIYHAIAREALALCTRPAGSCLELGSAGGLLGCCIALFSTFSVTFHAPGEEASERCRRRCRTFS